MLLLTVADCGKCAARMNEEPQAIPQNAVRYGMDAWMIEFCEDIGEHAYRLAEMIRIQLQESPPPSLREFTFSYTRVLLAFASGQCPDEAPEFLVMPNKETLGPLKVVDVCYDGVDLDRVAAHCGMGREDVIRQHSGAIYRVHCLGFAPGFPYLSGLPSCLHTPRLESPRALIPAGSVGIGAGQTGIYPLPTPGGWNLIGRVNIALFDPSAKPEACTFFKPGDRIRFHPVCSFG
jgi:allophanate hydrolase subunit 1